MGPQLWRLRKPLIRQTFAGENGRFNGAAALEAAETQSQESRYRKRCCFNGAAALEAAET